MINNRTTRDPYQKPVDMQFKETRDIGSISNNARLATFFNPEDYLSVLSGSISAISAERIKFDMLFLKYSYGILNLLSYSN